MTRDKATIGRILKDNGYVTSWFRKDHNTPEFQASQARAEPLGRPGSPLARAESGGVGRTHFDSANLRQLKR